MKQKANNKGTQLESDFDPDQYYKDNVEPYIQSTGVIKMWNYFIEITKTDYFQNFIRETRKKYNIPSMGFSDIDGHCLLPPEGFKKSPELRKEIIKKICKKYKLHYFDYSDIIILYILYDILQPLDELGSCGLFRVCDVIVDKEEPIGDLFEQSDDMAYPIAIRISPYASQRDLIDFVENKVVWNQEIKFLQNKYKSKDIKIGKVKKKKQSVQERNEFIWQNRHLPRKKIMSLVTDKFGDKKTIDYGHIGKIISLETKKRKEV